MITQLRTGLALVVAGALVSVPALVASPAAGMQTDSMAGQSLTITVGTGLKLQGTNGLRAGRIKLAVKGKPKLVSIISLARGYSLADLGKDYGAAGKGDMKALKRLISMTTFHGGLPGGSTGTVVLPRAGSYVAAVFGNKLGSPTTFRVGAVKASKAPAVDGKIIARKSLKWGGSDHLPAKGTLLFKNTDTQPHFIVMEQVQEGTTVEQVMEAFESEEEPAFALDGEAETDVLSPGRSMTMNYDLPPGQYVLMCFFPDPKMKGMPHAMMGMVKMIHVM